jgi:hypothetical protein
MMLFLYTLLYFALFNATVAAPVDSKGSELKATAEPFTPQAVDSKASKLDPNALPFTPPNNPETKLERGRVYATRRRYLVSYDYHSRHFRNLTDVTGYNRAFGRSAE